MMAAPDELLDIIADLEVGELLTFRDEVAAVLAQRPDAPPGSACSAFAAELAITDPEDVRALLRHIVEQRALRGDG